MGSDARSPAPLLHRSRLLTFAVGAVLLLQVAGAVTVVRSRDDLVRAAGPQGAVRATAEAAAQRRAFDEREIAVRRLLNARSRAVLTRDRALFLAGVDPAATEFRARQERLFDALADVPIGSWAYTLDPDREWPYDPAVLGHYRAETWVPEVELRYQLKGYDARPTAGEQFLTFVHRPQGWLIGNDADFPGVPNLQTDRELWDFGPVEVVTGTSSLVLGRRGRRPLLAEIARQADLSVPRVTAVWGRDWSQKVVVLVPETQDELGTLIEEGNDLSQIAAVAVAQLGRRGSTPEAVGNRIIVNPPNFARLSRTGRRIVLQHEITHVATRDYTGAATPTWLVEGFADYVGYLGTGVRTRDAAAELRSDVRAGRLPAALPADDEFTGTSPRLAQAYEMSWLACRLIAERTSPAALVRFYRELGRSERTPADALAAAMRTELSTTPSSFTAAWRSYLSAQLG